MYIHMIYTGAVGPTNRTLSMPPKVENAAFRNITFMELVAAHTRTREPRP